MRSTAAVTGAYLVLTILLTWPLARGLARDLPWDLGDSLLNCWILGWDADHLVRWLSGDGAALRGIWNANIFYPEPLALAYSEHLFAQSVQILPIYWLTGNLILCYNALFLSTFVLSGLGVFLFVRELTGSRRAGFASGLMYAFALYRIGQFSHLQVLSSQWMPFALYGMRRYFDTRRLRALAGASAALLAQNLSCGYFLLYFSPVFAAYVLYEIAARGLVRDIRVWVSLIAAATVTLALTWPFLTPYLELRSRGASARPLGEIVSFSADVYSYLTAHEANRVWGRVMRAYVQPEGELFPGLAPLLLAIVGVIAASRRSWNASGARSPVALSPVRIWLGRAAVVLGAVELLAFLLILAGAGGVWRAGPLRITISDSARALMLIGVAALVLLVTSPRARRLTGRQTRSVTIFFLAAACFSAFMSLGPIMRSYGGSIGPGPYQAFLQYVPGVDGLRVPARFGMIVMLCLSIMAGRGAREIIRSARHGFAIVLIVCALFIAEASAWPITINGVWAEDGLNTPPAGVGTGATVPPVFRAISELPQSAVIAHFPAGSDQYELRFMYYSTVHWRPLLNGYSGSFPRSYMARRGALQHLASAPDRAWTALAESGATHAVVHGAAYPARQAEDVRAWLRAHGARPVGTFGDDALFELP